MYWYTLCKGYRVDTLYIQPDLYRVTECFQNQYLVKIYYFFFSCKICFVEEF